MPMNRSPLPRSSAPSFKNEVLIAIGARAYINLPDTKEPSVHRVSMQDVGGRSIENDLHEGQEVEILAWRPRAPGGLAYQIRRLADGQEWWIPARYLRKSRLPAQAAPEPGR